MRTLAAATIIALAGANAAAASQAAPPGMVDSMGSELGMGLAAWRALALPGANAAQVTTACSDSAAQTRPMGGAGQGGGSVVCTYSNRVGGITLPLSLPLAQTYLVRNPRYDFVDGKLSKVEFHTSIDAFNDLTARFEARYGPAAQTLRDDVETKGGFDLPRVRKIWRLPKGSVEIIDPATPPTQLAVQFIGG